MGRLEAASVAHAPIRAARVKRTVKAAPAMNILFVHQNFPGQFKHLAPALVARGHKVLAMAMRRDAPRSWQGIPIVPVHSPRGSSPGIHPWLADIETKVIRGEAVFRAALAMKAKGVNPDVIIAHPGWGESLFLKEVWPRARLGLYCEFFYRTQGADTGFDPEFSPEDPGEACRLALKNANNLLHFQVMDAGISPTRWQADGFPESVRARITVAHDGIDTDAVKPDANAVFTQEGLTLTRQDEVITFVNRNLEPYRGCHVFLRALPALLKERPNARVLIVGGTDTSYGARPPAGKTWKDVFLDEVKDSIDADGWARVHFVGKLPYETFIRALQVSRVHVYLTYPFVLSWSLLESMACGCAIVASDTAPVREVLTHGETALLVDFFDVDALVRKTCDLIQNSAERLRLGAGARAAARSAYDLQTVCLPQQLAWVAEISGEAA
jgi:glycosyltransferase involved in cell wall biosynthesis